MISMVIQIMLMAARLFYSSFWVWICGVAFYSLFEIFCPWFDSCV